MVQQLEVGANAAGERGLAGADEDGAGSTRVLAVGTASRVVE